MITGLITFLGSSAGGSLLGFILDMLSEKRHQQRENAEMLYKERLAAHNQLQEHTAQLDKTVPGTLKEIKTSYKIGSIGYEKTRYKLFPTNVPTPRAWVVAFSLFLLVCAYTGTMLLFAAFPEINIITMDPEPNPAKLNLLIFSFEFPRNNTFSLSSGGVAYLMAHPLIFIISLAVTGTARKLAR